MGHDGHNDTGDEPAAASAAQDAAVQDSADQDGVQPASAAPPRVTFMTVLGSTLAAAIGVQSKANKERDFQHGSAAPFIAAGVIFTALFVGVLVLVVKLVLSRIG